MSTVVDIDTGQVLGVVEGRHSAAIGAWLAARSEAWRDAVQAVAIDPSTAFRKALREQLPCAAVSVDPFHLVKLGNDMLTSVRQRLAREQKQRRGRLIDPSWASRLLLLLRGVDTLTERGWARLRVVFAARRLDRRAGRRFGCEGAPADAVGLAQPPRGSQSEDAPRSRCDAADMPETSRLFDTICAWWDAIEVLIVTGATNARTEAANTSIKQIKRTDRGFRNEANYRARILLRSAARTAA